MPVDVDHQPIAWREEGPNGGHLVALLHGLTGSRTAWEPQLVALATAGYHAAAWDMPGYGASAPVDVLSFPQLADTLAGWLEELGTSAHLVGTSIGGMVALHLAVRHWSLVRSLTLASTTATFATAGHTAGDWVASQLAPLRAGRSPADVAHEVLRAQMAPSGTDGVHAAAVAAMARISPAGFDAAVHCLPTHDVSGELADIRCPTLLIAGDSDPEVPVDDMHDLARKIPGARLAVMRDCGHVPNLERADDFNRLMLDHLATAP